MTLISPDHATDSAHDDACGEVMSGLYSEGEATGRGKRPVASNPTNPRKGSGMAKKTRTRNSRLCKAQMPDGVDYSIKAYPTLYNGRQYRSRLEARWAAFFDVLKWRAEYEPFDLGSWSPDFLLHGRNEETACLVEVKPLLNFNDDVARKMECAVRSPDSFKSQMLLLSSSPRRHANGGVQIGWWSTNFKGRWFPWQDAFVAMAPDPSCSDDRHAPDIIVPVGDKWIGVLSANRDDPGADFIEFMLNYAASYLLEQWATASNLVQWQVPK